MVANKVLTVLYLTLEKKLLLKKIDTWEIDVYDLIWFETIKGWRGYHGHVIKHMQKKEALLHATKEHRMFHFHRKKILDTAF